MLLHTKKHLQAGKPVELMSARLREEEKRGLKGREMMSPFNTNI
jgi:hypothetical protein